MEHLEVSPCSGCAAAPDCMVFQAGVTGGNTGAPERIERLTAGQIASQDPANAIVVKEGWAARFIVFRDGEKRITEILLPGELANGPELVGAGPPPILMALSDLELCVVGSNAVSGALQSPAVLSQLLKCSAAHVSRLRELIVTTGKRSAERRVAAFILYMYHRLHERRLVNGAEMAFPLRQQDLADVLGLTQVHVSRMLKLLKDRGVISISDGGITITNMQSLTRIAQSPFD